MVWGRREGRVAYCVLRVAAGGSAPVNVVASALRITCTHAATTFIACLAPSRVHCRSGEPHGAPSRGDDGCARWTCSVILGVKL